MCKACSTHERDETHMKFSSANLKENNYLKNPDLERITIITLILIK
jgi:hypothetical protein